MSKAKLVITAVVVENRSQAEVARTYGVSKGWVRKLIARYRTEGDAAFEPRSRRPKTTPSAIGDAAVELIVRLRQELDGDVIDRDTSLGEQLLDVPVGQAVPQVPPHRHRDHLAREPETSERGGRRGCHDTSFVPGPMAERNSAPYTLRRVPNFVQIIW